MATAAKSLAVPAKIENNTATPRATMTGDVWTRFLEPVFVVASVLGYLGWTAATFHALSELRTHEIVAANESAPRLP